MATDGGSAASAAIRFATMMAEKGAWSPQAVTVFEPLPVAVADMALGPPAPMYQEVVSDSMLGIVQRQLRRHGGGAWTLYVEFGRGAPSIVRTAKEHGAETIVLGLGRHGKLARWVGAETVSRVARHSNVPVIAVATGTRRLPRTALVAIDFGESSIRAAHEALALLPPDGRLHLLHVRWAMDGRTTQEEEWERTYTLGVEQGFRRLVEQLRRFRNLPITTEMRSGRVIETTLKTAREVGADLIALGSHNQNVVDRMVLGFTPAAILRAARCAVLIAPPAQGG